MLFGYFGTSQIKSYLKHWARVGGEVDFRGESHAPFCQHSGEMRLLEKEKEKEKDGDCNELKERRTYDTSGGLN